jgi:DNA (cytosine-5)-methyltransferase 1
MRAMGDYVEDDSASTIKSRDYKDATDLVVAIAGNIIGRSVEQGGNGVGADASGVCYTLTSTDRHAVATTHQVRRLTPIECERLQGFPDGYTDIKPNGKSTPDSHRYKALGNSWAVPVVRWIGERIVQAINKKDKVIHHDAAY